MSAIAERASNFAPITTSLARENSQLKVDLHQSESFIQSKKDLAADLVFSGPIKLFRDTESLIRDTGRALAEWAELHWDPIYYGNDAHRGNGETVVIMGGFASMQVHYVDTVRSLRRLNYNAVLAPWSVNVRPVKEMGKRLLPFLRDEKRKSGHKVKFIGHSKGGFDGAAAFAQNPEEFVDYVDHIVFDASPRPSKLNTALEFAYLVSQAFERDEDFDIAKRVGLLRNLADSGQIRATSIDSSADPVIQGEHLARDHYVIDRATHTALGLNRHAIRAIANAFVGDEVDPRRYPTVHHLAS